MLQINTDSMYSIMRDFYTLTKIRIVIFDTQFKERLAYPKEKEGFCAVLRTNPEGEAGCQKSDRAGCLQCARTKSLVRYQCHAGLTEAVVPIIEKGEVLAYVMFGQIIPKETVDTTTERITRNRPDLASYVSQIPVKSDDELRAAGTVLQTITSYVITNRWVTPKKPEFISDLDRYIREHLSETISVEDICQAFRIGRTRLYEISLDYLGCGLAEYIRKQRIIYAQKMLKETKMPVTDIAYAVGFSDYNHFSRIFKQQTGISARQYRKTE